MRRREVIAGLGAAAWPLRASAIAGSFSARAQEVQKRWRIGFMRVGPPPAGFIDGFRQGMSDLGFVEGRHFVIEFALMHSAAQMADAAAELALSAVDVIVASGTPSVVPARDAAGRIPGVFVGTPQPPPTGPVKNLPKPGGSITGMSRVSGGVLT